MTVSCDEELDAELVQGLSDLSPQDWASDGAVCLQRVTDAVVQSHDDTAMTATFVIVSRADTAPNRAGRCVQLTPGPKGRGLRTEWFAKAPVVLYDHGQSGMSLPVGLAEDEAGRLDLSITDTQVISTCHFSRLPHAEPIYAAVAEGLLRAASIGFRPTRVVRMASPHEAVAAGVMLLEEPDHFDVTESELLEWSITPVGADRGALKQAIDRGRVHDVRLPQYLLQSFRTAAGPKAVWAPGVTLPPASPATPVSATPSPIALVAQAVSGATQRLHLQAAMKAVEMDLTAKVRAAVIAPIRQMADDVSKLRDELVRATGKVL
jgi:hypothetical protein